MKKIRFIIPMFAMMAIMVSCSDENDAILLEKETFAPGIEITDSVKVNQTEINNIVEDILSRPQSRQSDYTIETITDDNGKELMYVVNYSNNAGFVVISATKNYYPVLAYNDKGNFNIEGDMPLGLSIWNEGIKENIKYVNRLPSDSVIMYRAMWRKYESPSNVDIEILQTHSMGRSTPSWYQNAQTIMMNKKSEFLARGGCEVYAVTDRITGNNAIDEEIREYAREQIHPEYMDYWDVLSFVVRDVNPDVYTHIPNIMSTTWGQGTMYQVPGVIYYNSGFRQIDINKTALVGCGTVATGQVMRYYEYPLTFNWSDMPTNMPTSTTAMFLHQIAEDCKSTYTLEGTFTSQIDCLNTLKKYGYIGNIREYSFVDILDSLNENKPVMMRANPQGSTFGHAWVVTGGSHAIYDIRYELWTFASRTNFRKVQEFPDSYQIEDFLYMNWGYDGNYDGMYNINNLYIPGFGGNLINMTCIYDITPGSN